MPPTNGQHDRRLAADGLPRPGDEQQGQPAEHEHDVPPDGVPMADELDERRDEQQDEEDFGDECRHVHAGTSWSWPAARTWGRTGRDLDAAFGTRTRGCGAWSLDHGAPGPSADTRWCRLVHRVNPQAQRHHPSKRPDPGSTLGWSSVPGDAAQWASAPQHPQCWVVMALIRALLEPSMYTTSRVAARWVEPQRRPPRRGGEDRSGPRTGRCVFV